MGLFCMTSRSAHAGARGYNATLMALAVASLGMALMVFPKSASALQNVGGGYYCDVTTYDVDGEVQGWFYDNCYYDFGGGGHPGPDPSGYHPLPGGGGPGGGNPDPCSSGLVATEGAAHPNLRQPTDPGDGNGGGSNGGSNCGAEPVNSTTVNTNAVGTCKQGPRGTIDTAAANAWLTGWYNPHPTWWRGLHPSGTGLEVFKINFSDGSYKYYRWTKYADIYALDEYDSTCHE